MIYKCYKFRLYPTKKQVEIFESWLDLCRELYNAGLQERRDAWNLNRISVSYNNQCRELTVVKTIRTELRDVYAQVLVDTLRRLDKTFNAFFKRCKKGENFGFPRFKSKNRYNSFTYPQRGYSLTENKIILGMIGEIKIKLHQKVQGKIKTCTVKREGGKWFVILSVETLPEKLTKTNKKVGIDVGIESFATLSDGSKTPNPRHFIKVQKKLRKINRKLSRQKKGSKRKENSYQKRRKLYRKIKNQRNDFTHKLSREFVNKYDSIFVEDLKVKNMVKNKHLAKHIMDVAWSSFFSKLEYKAENAGREFVKVNPNNTSQNCSKCGIKVKKSLSIRVHKCPECKLEIDRDHNAALNILRLGLESSNANVSQ